MTERSVSLFEITDRRLHQNYKVEKTFSTEEGTECSNWIKAKEMMFPGHSYEEFITMMEDDTKEVTSVRVEIEFRRKDVVQE